MSSIIERDGHAGIDHRSIAAYCIGIPTKETTSRWSPRRTGEQNPIPREDYDLTEFANVRPRCK